LGVSPLFRETSVAVRHTPYSSAKAEPSSGPLRTRGWWIPDLAFSTLRVCIGLVIAWHGARVLFGFLLPPGQAWAGPPALWSAAWIEAVVQLGGGGLLALGLLTRPVAFLLAAAVILSQGAVAGRPAAWLAPGGELAVLFALVLLCYAMTGPGLFSFDSLVAGQLARRRRGNTIPMSPWLRRQYRRRELAR
jgi:putative oxidoreductase